MNDFATRDYASYNRVRGWLSRVLEDDPVDRFAIRHDTGAEVASIKGKDGQPFERADAWDEILRRRGASTAPTGTTPAPAAPTDFIGPLLKLAGIGIAAYVGVNLFRTFKATREAK